MKYLIFTCLLYALPVLADLNNMNLNFATYKEAAAAPQFLRFDMKSTKAGLITTSFTGFVKKAEVTYQEDAKAFKNITINFKADDMDTDIGGRNDKMWNKCLDAKNHPQITVKIASIEKGKASQQVPAVIRILDRDHDFQMDVSKAEDETLEGIALLGLKELGIPDPSIFIASVKDEIRVSFHFDRGK